MNKVDWIIGWVNTCSGKVGMGQGWNKNESGKGEEGILVKWEDGSNIRLSKKVKGIGYLDVSIRI